MLAQIRSRRLIDLSGLVHNLNVVTVGVEYPCCVIVRMILELGRRCSFLPSACCNCSYKEGIHLRMAFGDKTEVNGIRIGPPLFEPEEEASVISEAFKVWVTIVAFIVQKICDPERLESLGIKRDRTRKITHGQFHQLASAGRAVGSHLDLCPLAGHDAAGLRLCVRRARALAV